MNKARLRQLHRTVSVVAALPLALVVLTGIPLLLRGQLEWVQPRQLESERIGGHPLLRLEDAVALAPGPLDQVVFRPEKHALALRLKDGRELQLHPQTGQVLKDAQRRSSFLIELHQGSFLGPFGQNVLFLANALALLFLIVSGLLLYPRPKKGTP